MPNPRLAARYAKSLIDLSIERNQLEMIYKDMQYLQAVCKNSREFVNLMRSPVVAADKKKSIIKKRIDQLIFVFSWFYFLLVLTIR